MAPQYSLEVSPAQAVLGEPITATLRCVAPEDAAGVLTFDHRSLVLELDRANLIEPYLAFPNRRAVEAGGRLMRLSSPGGVEDLAAGEERTRAFELLPLFPEPVLSLGTFSVCYRLEETEPALLVPPSPVMVSSGPEAVALLLGHLSAENAAIRFRAAELLARMTARDFGYDPEAPVEVREGAVARFRDWWQKEGVSLPWNFQSEGATFGQAPPPEPPGGRSDQLGGIAFPEER
jgi:hypothetical protein